MFTSQWSIAIFTGLALQVGQIAATEGNSPQYRFSTFQYPKSQATRTATSNPPTSTPFSSHALPYTSVSSLFKNVSSTTWGNWVSSNTSATPTTAQPYGTAAFTSLWDAASPTNFTRGHYSTVVSPTPVPSSELVLPPPLYFQPNTTYQFPEDFIYGAAGSASQCEGAVADDGKSPSILDMLGTALSLNGSFGGGLLGGSGGVIENSYVTNEHYYLYKQDIERLASMGLKYYSFSIPWTRIMPFALPGSPVNTDAISHYNDVINFVLEKGMQPVVTLHHFDTPLQFFGGGQEYLIQLAGTTSQYGLGLNFGFQNSTFEDAYVHYAQIVMSHFADRVPLWITINEPQIGVVNGIAVNTVIKSHARVVHYYREVLKGTGKVSMKMGGTPAVPADPTNSSHIETANLYTELYIGAFLNPLALGIDYPEAFKLSVPDYVPLSKADLEYINGTMDFVSLDAYSAPVVLPATNNFTACALDTNTTTNPLHAYPICIGTTSLTPTGWSVGYSPGAGSTGLPNPFNLRTSLNYAWDTYRLPIVITEFGLQVPTPVGGSLPLNLDNVPGSEYLLSYLGETLDAIWEDGVHVLGAITWNWADDWELGNFDTGFGLQFVNRTTQERRYRRSFFDVIDYVEGQGRRQGYEAKR